MFIVFQVAVWFFSFFVLAVGIAGSHGNLSFSNGGWQVALIITVLLSLPLVYLLIARKRIEHKKLYFSIAIVVFILSMAALYIGLPTRTKKFIVDKQETIRFSFLKNDDLDINFSLHPVMFSRMYLEANIIKGGDSVDLKQLKVVVVNAKKQIVQPAFNP
ncbi:MAG: hypothetical protein WCF67_11950, partial [Chitinophagaceae bacterium]